MCIRDRSLTEQGLSAGPRLLGQARNAVQHPQSLPADRERYLSEVADSVRRYHERVGELETLARHRQHLKTSINLLDSNQQSTESLQALVTETETALGQDLIDQIEGFDALRRQYQESGSEGEGDESESQARLSYTSLSGTRIPRVSLPRYHLSLIHI